MVVAISQPDTGISSNTAYRAMCVALCGRLGFRCTAKAAAAQPRHRQSEDDDADALMSLRQLKARGGIVDELHHGGAKSERNEHQNGAEPMREPQRQRPSDRGRGSLIHRSARVS